MSRALTTCAPVVLGLVLVGCGSRVSPPAAPFADTSAATSVDPVICPQRLADTSDGDGMGLAGDATKAPALPVPDKAWICSYMSASGPRIYNWALRTNVVQITGDDLEALGHGLAALDVPHASGVCPADLGPRAAIVAESAGHRVALVVDEFGCADIRLTDDLGTVPAGAPSGPGTVRGVVGAPDSLRRLVLTLAKRLTPVSTR